VTMARGTSAGAAPPPLETRRSNAGLVTVLARTILCGNVALVRAIRQLPLGHDRCEPWPMRAMASRVSVETGSDNMLGLVLPGGCLRYLLGADYFDAQIYNLMSCQDFTGESSTSDGEADNEMGLVDVTCVAWPPSIPIPAPLRIVVERWCACEG